MKRTSPYWNLRWRVDCERPPNPATWWETIAAFDSDRIALDYASRCRRKNERHGFRYRVMERRGRGWVEIRMPSL